MKKIIICLIMVLTISFVAAQTSYNIYYKLNLDYDTGKINISSTEIEFSQEKIENYFGVYTAGLMNYNNEILNLSLFGVPNIVLWDGINLETGEIDKGGIKELNKTSFEIFIPYYENAKEIIIYDENLSEVIRKDVSEYSKQREYSTDENDTKKERDKFVKDKISDENLSEKIAKYWWIFLIILILLIITLIYSLQKKKK